MKQSTISETLMLAEWHNRKALERRREGEADAMFGGGGLTGRSIVIFDLLIQSLSQNHLRKMRILKKPDFEEFDENATKSHYLFSSQMKKNMKMLATFAKNEYLCTR